MNRRGFVALMGGVLAAPSTSFAQQAGRGYRVAAMVNSSEEASRTRQQAFTRRLAEHGFAEGRNLQVDWRFSFVWAEDANRLARELIAAKPDALFAASLQYTRALKRATKTIPIVFADVSDALAFGVVKDVARPGENATGVSLREFELVEKRFELLRELLPQVHRVAVVANGGEEFFKYVRERLWSIGESRLGFKLALADFSAWDVLTALEDVRRRHGMDAIFYLHPSNSGSSVWIAPKVNEYAMRHRVPTVFADTAAVAAGGLIGYGADPEDDWRRAADQLARVLKGAKPAELPVDQASRFELAVNMKTAKTLGIKVPQSVLLRADRVIE